LVFAFLVEEKSEETNILPTATVAVTEEAIKPEVKETTSPTASPTPVKTELPEKDVPARASKTAEPEEENKTLTCNLSVRCDTILNNLSRLKADKQEIIPPDGVIFPEQSVVFYEGETVFNVMIREMKKNKIHFEFENTPMYESVYIEGIANIYEFDCGELSGWMYKVNGEFLSVGCSQCELEPGDRVEILYSCDLGKDLS